jgi:Protein of unknown function (DUF3592)
MDVARKATSLAWWNLSLGIVFLAVAAYVASSTRAFVSAAAKADGTVVSLARVDPPGGGGGFSYAAVVRFRLADGEERTFQDSTLSTPPSYEVGQRVAVLYDPAHAERAQIRGFFSLWAMPLVFAGIGVLLTAIGIYQAWR